MTASPWYAFYPKDYRDKTSGLTMAQDGAYRRLMDEYYVTCEPLPLAPDEVARICRAFTKDERAAVLFVLKRYFVEGDDGWHHLRIDEEIIKRAELSAKRAQVGSKGGSKTQASVKQLLEQSGSKTEAGLKHVSQSQSHSPNGEISSLRSDNLAKRPSKSKTRLPEIFPLPADLSWSETYWLQRGRTDLCSTVLDQIQHFRDHHTAKGTTSADWPASWRTWTQNAIKFNNGAHNGRRQSQRSAHDKFLSAAASIIEDASEDGGPEPGHRDHAA